MNPIGFRSTIGCRWLLTSLKLDGSEIVEPSIDGRAINGGQSFPRDKILIFNLLNFQISRSAEPEIDEHCSKNLAGVDLDNLFTYANSLALNLKEERAVTSKQTDYTKLNSFSGRENPSFPPNVQQIATSVSSTVAMDNDDPSGWKADFQSADSGSQP